MSYFRGGVGVNDALFLKKVLFKRISIRASTLRARKTEYKEELIRQLLSDNELNLIENITNVSFY